jgi:hypothetical protein
MHVSSQGLITWLPQSTGDASATVTVSDGQGGRSSVTLTLHALKVTENDAPQIQPISGGQAVVGLPYQLQVNADDPNGGTLTYSLSDGVWSKNSAAQKVL